MSYTEEISLFDFFRQFPDEESARKYFEVKRWGTNIACPHCGSTSVSECLNLKPMPYRCKDCRKHFSVRTGTVLEESRIGLHKWLMAIYMMTTARKGISSVQMAKQLGITQKSAWFLAQRIRESWFGNNDDQLEDTVEVDETFIGGLEKNKHSNKKLRAGRGSAGKLVVVGMKQRNGRVIAKPVKNTEEATLKGFIHENVKPGSTVYTDNFRSYQGLTGYTHGTVDHSKGEYVNGDIYTNSIESFWALIKRGYKGIYHYMSQKHLHRYVNEYAFRHNLTKQGTMAFIDETIKLMNHKRLTYKDLING